MHSVRRSGVKPFGHGDERSWLTSGSPTVDTGNVQTAVQAQPPDKVIVSVVSIACKTSCLLAPAAIKGGAVAWLGFGCRIPIIDKHKGIDPIGDAFVSALSCLGAGASMQDAHDAVVSEFDTLVSEFDTGKLRGLYISFLGYFGSMAIRDNCVVYGSTTYQPMI